MSNPTLVNKVLRLGFSTTCVILGGQTLASINPGTLPLTAGIVIVGLGSLIPCFIGYNMVRQYEHYAWTAMTLVIMFLWSLGTNAGFNISAQKAKQGKGKSLSSDILGFRGVVLRSFNSVSILAPIIGVGAKPRFQVVPSCSRLQLSPPCEHSTY